MSLVILGMILLGGVVGAYDVNKAILEADATTPSVGTDDEAVDLFFSRLDEDEADKAAANFNAAVSRDAACHVTSAAPTCGPSGATNNPTIVLRDGCTFALQSPGFAEGQSYPNGPYSCTWTFTTNGTDARSINLAVAAADFAVAGKSLDDGSCGGDSVTVRRISANRPASRRMKREASIGAAVEKTFCGSISEDKEINTRSNTVAITFRVDGSVNAAGFKIAVSGRNGSTRK